MSGVTLLTSDKDVPAMAQHTIVELTDDLNGKPADETVNFALDGRAYEIDLSEANAAKLRKALAPYVDAGRRTSTGRGRGTGRRAASPTSGVDSRAVRAWAASKKIKISDRGRLPKDVVERYLAAGN